MSRSWILAVSALAAAVSAPALPAAQPATGPSFSCAKASTPVEKAICASPALAKLDRQMAAAYSAAAAITPTPVTLRSAQRSFLIERGRDSDGKPAKTVNIAQLTELYTYRIQALTEETARAGRATAARIRDEQLASLCVDVAITDCKVEDSGPVSGSGPYGGLFYQVQGPNGEDGLVRGVVVLKGDGPGFLRPVLWNFEGDYPAKPEVVKSPSGPLLVVPAIHGGTGRFNAEQIYRPLAGGGWRDIDIDAWRFDFNDKLPKEVGVWKGVIYDFEALTLETALWKDTDSNCCPTGGTADAVLTVKGDELALKSMKVDRTPPKEE